jgi:glutathione S-transferase
MFACAMQAVPFELVQVDLSDKPSWYRAINPRGLVPAVVHQGEAGVESLDLCR